MAKVTTIATPLTTSAINAHFSSFIGFFSLFLLDGEALGTSSLATSSGTFGVTPRVDTRVSWHNLIVDRARRRCAENAFRPAGEVPYLLAVR
jgi:hypothetical protein